MRCFAGVQTCLTLLLAFFLAPFQHVHTGPAGAADHDHPGLIHAHFYSIPALHRDRHDLELQNSDDDHAAAWSLDTFTLVLTAGLAPFVPPRGIVLLFVPSVTFEPIADVEECSHGPPRFDRSIPRAPPS
jgi:hypothetical protein